MKKSFAITSCLLSVLLFGVADELFATNRTWTGGAGDGDWYTAGNRRPSGTPATVDYLTVTNGGTIGTSTSVYQGDGSAISLSGSSTVVNFSSTSSLYSAYTSGSTSRIILNNSSKFNTRNAYLGQMGFSDISLNNSSIWNDSSTLYFGYRGSCNIFIDYSSKIHSISSMFFGYNEGSVAEIDMGTYNAEISSDSNIFLGYNGTSSLAIPKSGRIVADNGTIYMAYGESSSSSAVLSGFSSYLDSNYLYCGREGDASLELHNGAQVIAGSMYIASDYRSNSSVLVTGGSTKIDAVNLYCGYEGIGTMTLTQDAYVDIEENLSVGYGSKVIIDDSMLRCSAITGLGTVQFKSGTMIFFDDVTVDSDLPLGSSLDFDQNHTFITGGTLKVSPGSMCRFDQAAVSATNFNNYADVYLKSGGNVTTTSSIENSGYLSMDGGLLKAGTMLTNTFGGSIAGEGTLEAPAGIINYGSVTATGNLAVKSSFTNHSQLNVNYTNSSFNCTSTVNNFGSINLAGALSSTSLYNRSNGIIAGSGYISSVLTNDGGLIYANNGTLTLSNLGGGNINGGVLQVADNSTLRVNTAFDNNGLISLDGDNASLAMSYYVNNYGMIDGSGRISGNLDNFGQINVEDGTMKVGGYLSNSSGAMIEVQDGSKLVAIQGLALNNGSLNLYGGRFDNGQHELNNYGYILGNGTISASEIYNTSYLGVGDGDMNIIADNFYQDGTVYVQDGSTLTFFADVFGAGTFAGTGSVVFLAGYTPGLASKSYSFAGNVASMGTITLEAEGAVKGLDYQSLAGDGDFTAGGSLLVSAVDGYSPALGDSLDLFDFDSIQGSFTAIVLPELARPLSWDLSQIYSIGVVTVVPEPVTVSLLLAGGMLALKRRRA